MPVKPDDHFLKASMIDRSIRPEKIGAVPATAIASARDDAKAVRPPLPVPSPGSTASIKAAKRQTWTERLGLSVPPTIPMPQASATPVSIITGTTSLPPQFLLMRCMVDSRRGMPASASARPQPQHSSTALTEVIRQHLLSLASDDAQRFTRLLNNILQTRDISRHPELLHMLASTVIAAERRHNSTLDQSPAWQLLSRTSVALRFDGDLPAMSSKKETELLELRLQMMKLPTEIAARYLMLLQEVLVGDDLKQRDALLRQLGAQVATHLHAE